MDFRSKYENKSYNSRTSEGENLYYFGQAKGFCSDTKNMIYERKKDKLDLFKIKNGCSTKLIIERMKRQAANCKKPFTSHISDKRLLFKIY